MPEGDLNAPFQCERGSLLFDHYTRKYEGDLSDVVAAEVTPKGLFANKRVELIRKDGRREVIYENED
jgi:hypothetical protein